MTTRRQALEAIRDGVSALIMLEAAEAVTETQPAASPEVQPDAVTPPVSAFPPIPTVSILDAQIDGAAREVHVTVELSGPVRHTVYVPVGTSNGNDPDGTLRMSERSNYTRVSETVIFRPGDTPRKTVTIPLKGNSKPGQYFYLGTAAEVPGAKATKTRAKITIVPGATTQSIAGPLAPAHVPRRGAVTFSPDLSAVEAHDTGLIEGRRVWLNRLRHGRTQDGNKEVGYYAPDNWRATPEGLILQSRKLETRREETVNGQTRLFDYDASVLTTQGLFAQQYGYWEADIKTPSARGAWGAFWLLPSGNKTWWPPELDIMEHPRNHQFSPGHTTATHHWKNANGGVSRIGTFIDFEKLFQPGFDATTDFHKYAVDWREDFTTWFIDEIEIFRAPTEAHEPAYLLLNVAVGGWGGTPDYSEGTTDMIVRDLKVYA